MIIGQLKETHLHIKFIKCHDGSKVEEREVKVVLEQLQDAVVPIFPFTVFQSKTQAAHDGEPTASIEEDMPQLKVSFHKTCLCRKLTVILHIDNQMRDSKFASCFTCQDTKGSHLNVARVQRPATKQSQRIFTKEML